MRQVLSLSLPATEIKLLKKTALVRGYTSVSAYVKSLFEADKDTISENTLLSTAKKADKEYQKGRSVRAKSIAELV